MAEAVLRDYWRSSSAYRVRIGLNLAGIAYRSVPVDLVAGDQRGAAHLAANPQGLVPVLEMDGLRLTQSLAILDYLDEAHGAGFLPKDPGGRARVRALAMAVAMEIQPVCNLRVAKWAVAEAGGAIATEGWMRHFIAEGLADVEAMLDGWTGGAPGLFEICLVPQVYNARRWGVDLGAMPKLAQIADRAAEHPAFAAAHPDRVKPG